MANTRGILNTQLSAIKDASRRAYTYGTQSTLESLKVEVSIFRNLVPLARKQACQIDGYFWDKDDTPKARELIERGY